MRKQVPFTNDTAGFVHVGGFTIPPGATRMVDEMVLPGYAAAKPAAEAADTSGIAALLEKSVEMVKAGIGDLSIADLEILVELENAGKSRKTLIDAVEKEIAFRADEMYLSELLGKDAEAVIAALPEMSAATLAHLVEAEEIGHQRAAVLEAAAAAQLNRAGK